MHQCDITHININQQSSKDSCTKRRYV